MKKARKLGLQSLALVLMAFVLVAGVAFGMTGAWFQDKDAISGATVTMGHKVLVEMKGANDAAFSLTRNARTVDDGTDYAMPGDTYAFSGVSAYVPANSSKMYVIIKVSNNIAALTGTAVSVQTGENAWTAFTGEGLTNGYYFRVVDTDKDDAQELAIYAAGTLTVPSTWNNEHADQTIEIAGKVCAIQYANVSITAATTATELDTYLNATDASSEDANWGAFQFTA